MQAILIVSFGTSHLETLEKTIGAIEQSIAATYPDYEMRRAFTSGVIREKLSKRDGIQIDTLAQALERLAADGYTKVICQPSYIINGLEYDAMKQEGDPFRDRFTVLQFGRPLLSTSADYDAVTEILLQEHTRHLGRDTALVLMGHGTAHSADSAYAALDYRLKRAGHAQFFVGTVEGYPDLPTLLAAVEQSGFKKVLLAPLMVVAGDHAVHDLSGDGADSWKTTFQRAGFAVQVLLRGLGEYPGIQQMFCAHTAHAIQQAELIGEARGSV